MTTATGNFLLQINTSVVTNNVQKLSCKFYSMTIPATLTGIAVIMQGQSTCTAMVRKRVLTNQQSPNFLSNADSAKEKYSPGCFLLQPGLEAKTKLEEYIVVA